MRSKFPYPKIGGTLDIGAGDRPYARATVAVDWNIPDKPKHIPKGVGPIKVMASSSALPAIGIPTKLTKSSRLRLYWAGDASELPESWDGKFSEVVSRNAIWSLEKSKFREPYAVLKKGGKLYVLANPPVSVTNQEAATRRHIDHVVNQLEKAGFVRVEYRIFGSYNASTSFTATKPVRKHTSRKGTGRVRSAYPCSLGCARL